jgi:hypothetical protein
VSTDTPSADTGATQATADTVVVTEVALADVDVTRMTGLHEGQDWSYRVLVPADTARRLLVSVLDHLSLFDMRAALGDLRAPDPQRARTDAERALTASLAALAKAGVRATGAVVADNPLPDLGAEIERCGAREVVIVTRPHAVEDTFHTDWASRAREEFGLPVLHMYAGDWRLG